MYVELGNIGDLDVNIGSLNLNPVLKLRLKDNPTGVGLNANIDIKTYDKEGKQIEKFAIPTISINSEGSTEIILSTSRNESKYKGDGVTFVAVDKLSQILKNIPAKIGVDMEVLSNKDEEVTINLKDAAKGYNLEYQYEVLLPLEFDGDIELSYETTVMGLNKTFVSLADSANGLKVGDIGLIAELSTTLPFNIVFSAELVNSEGVDEGINARLNINDCVIDGYSKEADGEKKISKIDLDFDLGESGSFEGLRAADGVRLKFSIYNTNDHTAALADNQYIDGKLKLRVREGLTIDIFNFLKEEE